MSEAILEPGLPIIDAHHHLLDLRPSMTGDLPPPRHPFEATLRTMPVYLFDDLLADMRRGHNVIGTVYMECGAMFRAGGDPAYRCVGETEFVNGVAAMSASGTYGDVRACSGIIGHADLTLGSAVKDVLEAHIAAGGGRFRGVRISAPADPDPDVVGPMMAHRQPDAYRQPKFREGFAQLAPLGLSFDAFLLEPQLGDLIDLARAFPETTIVVDHVGGPVGIASYAGRREERFAVWRESIRALAGLPNVAMKVGGLAMAFPGFPSFMASPPAPSTQLAEEWRPYVETCIDAFGPQRCMFESNFPVDRATCAYDVLWNAFKILGAGYSADEKTALFSDTARRVYRLDI
jgi:predicted TIM-barrel fold metal-dependent hydrolase